MIAALRNAKTRKAEGASHKAEYRLFVMPAKEHGHWYPLPVVDYVVTMNERGVPGAQRTLTATIALSHATQANVSKLDVLGSWVKADVVVDALFPEPFKFTVPLGFFQVQRLTVGIADGIVQIEAADAGRTIEAHAAISLADRTRAKGASKIAWLRQIVEDCWPAGTPKAHIGTTGFLDISEAADSTLGSALWSVDGDRAVVVNSIVSTLRAKSGTDVRVHLVPDVDGSHVFRLVAQDKTPVATISPYANLTGGVYTEDRTDLLNSVHVVWSGQVTAGGVGAGVVGVTQQQRSVVSLADGEIRWDGPFGLQSAEVAGSDRVTSRDKAKTEGEARMNEIALAWSHDLPVSCSPVYGIESGDWVHVDGHGACEVVGGTIASQGDWSLLLRKYEKVRTSRPSVLSGTIQHEGDRSDDAVWSGARVPVSLAVNFGSNTGWTLTGGRWYSTGTPAKVQPGEFEATATRARLTSVNVIPVPKTRRVRVTFRINTSKVTSASNAKGKGLSAKAGIQFNGKTYWNQQPLDLTTPPDDVAASVSKRGESIEVTSDMQLPAGASTFAVVLEMWGLSTNQYVEISEARVEVGSRPKST